MNTELKEKMQKAAEKISSLQSDEIFKQLIEVVFMSGSTEMYAELATLVEWVSVKERLPKQGQDCLFKSEKSIYFGFYDYSVFRTFDRNIVREDITHWRMIEL